MAVMQGQWEQFKSNTSLTALATLLIGVAPMMMLVAKTAYLCKPFGISNLQ